MKKQTFIVIDARELDEIVNKNFPQFENEYNFVEAEEVLDDGLYRWEVDSSQCDMDLYLVWEKAKIHRGDWEGMTESILSVLAKDGILENGEYLIDV